MLDFGSSCSDRVDAPGQLRLASLMGTKGQTSITSGLLKNRLVRLDGVVAVVAGELDGAPLPLPARCEAMLQLQHSAPVDGEGGAAALH